MPTKETDARADQPEGQKLGQEDAGPNQRDPQQNSPHMPRHWQAPGTRGEVPGQAPPGPDDREIARGNQYGEAGEAAAKQVHEASTEHGETLPPQQRENENLPKRAGERPEDLPTPKTPGSKE